MHPLLHHSLRIPPPTRYLGAWGVFGRAVLHIWSTPIFPIFHRGWGCFFIYGPWKNFFRKFNGVFESIVVDILSYSTVLYFFFTGMVLPIFSVFHRGGGVFLICGLKKNSGKNLDGCV